MQQQVYELIMKEDDISWQSMLYDLVRSEGMDPWDIDVATLSDSFVQNVLKLKESNLLISGKIVLACALLLKFKSKYLLENGLSNLDQLFDHANGELDTFEEDDSFIDNGPAKPKEIQKKLVPRTPQPRERKVSIYDLVESLAKALEVKSKAVSRLKPKVKRMHVPLKKMDISILIKDVYRKIRNNDGHTTKFSKLLDDKEVTSKDKIFTFMPLLHLHNLRKIHLIQEEHFDDFDILHLRDGVQAPEDEYEQIENQKKLKAAN